MARRTKIVVTVGPATDEPSTMRRLVAAGMDMARISLAHGPLEDSLRRIAAVRAAANEERRDVGVLIDLPGPKIRTTRFTRAVWLTAGDSIDVLSGPGGPSDDREVTVDHDGVLEAVRPDERIRLGDGGVELLIEAVGAERAKARVLTGGELQGRPGVAIPGDRLPLDTPTPDDLRLLDALRDAEVDAIAVSFVRSASDVQRVRSTLPAAGPMLIAKIETRAAVDNTESIVDAADAVMVARGDLGIRCDLEDVPHFQKHIIRTAVAYGRPVITATQMLESMIHAPTPTRAEASDVANAVLDGTSAVMLSAETAIGHDPVLVVETMDRITGRAEQEFDHPTWGASLGRQQQASAADAPAPVRITAAISAAAWRAATDADASVIIACTTSGATARSIARFRPVMPILAVTPSPRTARQLTVAWGITAVVDERRESGDEIARFAVRKAVEVGAAQSGDIACVLVGSPFGADPVTDNVRLVGVQA